MSSEIYDVRPFAPSQQPPECMILSLQAVLSRRDYPMHIPQRLHSYMVTLFTKGGGQHLVDFHWYSYGAHSLLFVAENQVHQWQLNYENDGLVLAFSKAFLYKNDEDQRVFDNYRIFDYALQSPILLLEEGDYERIKVLFEEVRQEVANLTNDALNQEIIRNLVRTILLRAERLKRTPVQPPALSQYHDFVAFKERVEQDFTRTRNVKDYASALGYSPKKLNQLSMAVLNKGAKSFIDERVLLEIKRLLIHTDLSVKEITERTGFDEPTNLVKFFKRYTQKTPTTFRDGFN